MYSVSGRGLQNRGRRATSEASRCLLSEVKSAERPPEGHNLIPAPLPYPTIEKAVSRAAQRACGHLPPTPCAHTAPKCLRNSMNHHSRRGRTKHDAPHKLHDTRNQIPATLNTQHQTMINRHDTRDKSHGTKNNGQRPRDKGQQTRYKIPATQHTSHASRYNEHDT